MGVVIIVTAIISAFMNNTPQVVLMIPILTAVAMRSSMSPSKLLMPMTFASQIGGMGTPIGTSLNLLVIGSAASLGVERFHMFDFIAPASLAAIPGLLFLWLVAPQTAAGQAAVVREYLAAHFRRAAAYHRHQPGRGQDAGGRKETHAGRDVRGIGAALGGFGDLAAAGCDPARSAINWRCGIRRNS